MRRLGGQHEDGRILRRVAFFHVVGRERARFLVLGDAVSVFPRVSQCALVEQPRPAAADVEQHEAQRAADGGVGAVARAEHIAAGVHADRAAHRPVHHQQRTRHVSRGLHAVQVEARIAQGEQRCFDHRGVFGPAAGHHHVDRQHFAREAAPARRHAAHQLPAVAAECVYGCRDFLRRGWNERQAVGVAALIVELDEIGAFRCLRCSGRRSFLDGCVGSHDRFPAKRGACPDYRIPRLPRIPLCGLRIRPVRAITAGTGPPRAGRRNCLRGASMPANI
ncbi:hypothetical protein D3C83_02960 [compost metagenome]